MNFEFTNEKRGDPPGLSLRFKHHSSQPTAADERRRAQGISRASPNAANSSTTTRGRVTTTELYRRAVNGKRECAPQFSGLRATVLGLLQWFSFETSFRAGELSVGRRVSHSDVDVLSSQQVYEPREAGILPPSQVDLQSRLATKRNEAKCRGERGLV